MSNKPITKNKRKRKQKIAKKEISSSELLLINAKRRKQYKKIRIKNKLKNLKIAFEYLLATHN